MTGSKPKSTPSDKSNDGDLDSLLRTSDARQAIRAFDSTERVLGFVFAAADMVVEVDEAGRITFAAGAFLSRFDCQPEAFVGRSVRELFAPADYQTIDTALALLIERRRLAPIVIRLGNGGREQIALGGIALAARGGLTRLCLTLARLPTRDRGLLQIGRAPTGTGRHDLASIARNRSRTGEGAVISACCRSRPMRAART